MTEIIKKSKALAKLTACAVKKTEIGRRIFSDKPEFWKKVQRIGLIIGGIGTLIVALPIGLPAGIITAGTYFITAGGVLAGIAQLPLKDKSDEEIKKAIEEGLKEAGRK